MSSNPYLLPQRNRNLTILAWVAAVLVSAVPDIVWIEIAKGSAVPWLAHAKMALMLAFFLCALFWKPLFPLRSFFLVMFAFFGLTGLREHVDFSWPALQRVFGGNAFDVRMQAEQTGKLAVSLGMIALLLVLGYKRRNFFLTRGHLRAPMKPAPLLGFPKPDPWQWFGLQWSIYIALGLGVMIYFSGRPTPADLLKVVPLLPSILFYAALNAFNEEMTFRAPMLATLEPVGGSSQALWISAFFFGIAHYFGMPGGMGGGVASVFMGWILGKAMVETRGLFWAWWIHFLSDIVIFTFLSIRLVGSQ